MTRFLVAALGALLSLISVPLWADHSESGQNRIYGYALEYRLQERGRTQYNKLFKALSNFGLSFELVVQPVARIMRDIDTHNHCIFPASINAINTLKPQYRDLELIASHPVDHISLRVFTRAGAPVVEDLSQLNGKRVAVWGGIDASHFLRGLDVTVEITPSELVRVKMLDKGRIDAILGFTPDVVLAAEQLSFPAPVYADSLALFRGEGASVVCHDTPDNRVFVDQFNHELSRLKASGELRTIMGPHVELAM